MADSSGGRSTLTFVLGFLLGLLVGAGGTGALVFLLLARGESAPPEAVTEPPAAVTVAPAEPPAPEPVVEPAPPPAPEPAPAAPVAAPKPKPKPAAPPPAPAPEPAKPKPAVSMNKGPTDFTFVGEDGKRYSPNAVPPGTYTVMANWGDGLVKSGTVTVKEGKPVKLVCDPPSRTCSAK